MISPLTLIVVLATTLAVASPVPETKKVQPSLQDISAKRLVKADCIGEQDIPTSMQQMTNILPKDSTTNSPSPRKP